MTKEEKKILKRKLLSLVINYDLSARQSDDIPEYRESTKQVELFSDN